MDDILRPKTARESKRQMQERKADLEELQARIEEHMKRLSKLEELGAPAKVIRQEKQMLREAMDALRKKRVTIGEDVMNIFKFRILRPSSKDDDNN